MCRNENAWNVMYNAYNCMKMSGGAVNGARNTKNKRYSQIIITTHFIHKILSAIQKLTHALSNVVSNFHIKIKPHFGVPNTPETQVPM